MAGPLIQNFSVEAGDPTKVNVDVDPDVGVSLLGATIYWSVYAQKFTMPYGDPILRKVSDHGITITDAEALKFQITIDGADTTNYLGNFYHETQIIDSDNNLVTVNQGIMTIKRTVNRDYSIPA